VDGAVRDVEELAEMGLPIWARWVRVHGADKNEVGTLDEPVVVGGATIRTGDVVVLDADGAAVVEAERVDEVLEASLAREEKERVKREQLQSGHLSYDLDGLRAKVEKDGQSPSGHARPDVESPHQTAGPDAPRK
jgi:4-hydroxy-4-methyl-2-oxoglutarate aldolase